MEGLRRPPPPPSGLEIVHGWLFSGNYPRPRRPFDSGTVARSPAAPLFETCLRGGQVASRGGRTPCLEPLGRERKILLPLGEATPLTEGVPFKQSLLRSAHTSSNDITRACRVPGRRAASSPPLAILSLFLPLRNYQLPSAEAVSLRCKGARSEERAGARGQRERRGAGAPFERSPADLLPLAFGACYANGCHSCS